MTRVRSSDDISIRASSDELPDPPPLHSRPEVIRVPAMRSSGVGTGCIVVGGILCIFILAAYYGTTSRITVRGMKSSAVSAGIALSNAVLEYDIDYDRLPLASRARRGGDLDCDTSAAAGMISVLKGIDPAENAKETDYLGEIKDAKSLKSPGIVDGIYRDSETSISLYDPWGHFYWMRLDANKDGRVEDPSHPGAFVSKKVIIWSAGKDGDFTTWNDNVTNW